ncbi:MAG TPA: CBS domain-containing protein [Bryobacteraceae bacterium]|nr:CBS domain-containing protein [Bryobacteraceae bacterium]
MNLSDPVRSILHNKPREIFSINPDASVFEALETMADRGIGALLVLSGGRLIGILSERDYARKVILKGKSSRATRVADIMTSPATIVTPDRTVDECMRLMTENRIRHLPVVENDWIFGVVSIGDLVNWTISAQEHAINQLHSYIAGEYPG